jgi:ATP-binding cassette subfamily B protein
MDSSFTKSNLFWLFISEKKIYVILMIIMISLGGLTISIDGILLKNIINTISNDSTSSFYNLFPWIILYGVYWESLNILWRLYDYLYYSSVPYIKAKIIDFLFNYVQKHSHKFFMENLAGTISNKINDAARSFELCLALFIESFLRKFISVAGALIALYLVHPAFCLVFFIWLVFFVGFSFYIRPFINQYTSDYANKKTTMVGKIVDVVYNISSVRMFHNYKKERYEMSKYTDDVIASDIYMQKFMLKARYLQGLSCSLLIMTILYFLSYYRSINIITIGDFALVLSIITAITTDIWDLSQDIGDFYEDFGAIDASFSLLQSYEVKDDENRQKLMVQKGEIKFDNVSFKYPKNNELLFKDKSIVIKGGEKVGLVGLSGSGKSTFINLILRLYEISSGKIMIDNQDLSQVTFESLRKNISIIPQDPILFNRTIFENIQYGKNDATDEEVVNAAKLAHIHEAILKMPDGYNTMCGERGQGLSGGQRQRVAIARAYLENAPILILDEATSAQDSITENLIQESLHTLMKNKTTLIIAHRLSTIFSVDRIIVFNDGTIIEDGTHKQLIANESFYSDLWKKQSINNIL